MQNLSVSILKNRNFLLLWLGSLFSLIGNNIYSIAFVWWSLQKTGSALIMGSLISLSILTYLLVSPFAGVYVDRWNRRNIMVYSDFLSGLLTVIMAIMEFTGHLALWHVYTGTVIFSAISAFGGTADFALLPQIVPKEQLVQANALREFSTNGSTILGAAIGGVFIGAFGIPSAFLFCGLALLFTAGFESFIRVAPQIPSGRNRLSLEIREGFRYLKEHQTLLGIFIVLAVVDFAGFPIYILLPLFADRVFHVGAQGLGWMEAIAAAGTILATFFLFRFSPKNRRYFILQVSLLAMGFLFLLAGLTTKFPVFLSLLGGMGFLLGIINVQIFSYFQMSVPEAMMGRVMSLLNTVLLSLQPIGYAIGGVLAEDLGAETTIILCGLGILVGSLLFAFIPRVREI